MSFVSWHVACRYRVRLFVLSNRSCEWSDLLIKICVNISSKGCIYIYQLDKLYPGNSHHACMFAHICRGVVHFNSGNVFEIYNSLYVYLTYWFWRKTCPGSTDANCFWSTAKCTFYIHDLLKIQLRNCNVYVWDLSLSVATMFLYWFEKLTNVIRDPSWSNAQQSKDMFFLDIPKSSTGPLVVMIYGAVRFHLAISLVMIVSICVLFISIISHEEWTFSHCWGIGHEHCYALCSPMFFF